MQSSEKPDMVPVGEYIVGTLVVRGLVKPEDAARAVAIVEEELKVWLAIRDFNKPN
jgi:hypothetical protein